VVFVLLRVTSPRKLLFSNRSHRTY